MDFKLIGLIVVGAIASFFATGYFNVKEDLETTEFNMSVMNDSVQYYQKKDGTQVAKIRAFEGKKANLFLKLESKDKEIIKLQKEVRRVKGKLSRGGGVVRGGSTTKVITQTNTVVKFVDKDTVYTSHLKDSIWYEADIRVTKDSTMLDLKVGNKYTVVVGETKNGLFKKPTPFVEVSNDNPYTSTTALRAYKVSAPDPKRWGIGVTAGYGITKSSLSPYVGIGISYNLIQW